MRICVIGAGYVGLVSGICLADRGHDVVCVDLDPEKVRRINAGVAPIHEAGLEQLLRKHVGQRFTATTDLSQAVRRAELTLICVGTPARDGRIDLSHVEDASRQVGAALRRTSEYHAVIVKSTVVPGTTDDVVRPALEAASGRQAGVDFGVGMNPEFLTEGQAVADFMNPDRIVLGGMDERTLDTLARVYSSFSDVATLRVNNRTAEMIKYASNAMLATQISFANEIANLCQSLGGIDVTDVQRGVHLSYYLQPFVPGSRTRVRAPIASFLEAGCGFGGSCLPKDVTSLIAHAKEAGVPMRVLEAVLQTNTLQPAKMLELLERHFPSLDGVRVTVLGLAFKPDTDDMRESPAVPIIRGLLAGGAVVRAYDPVAMQTARRALAGDSVSYCETLEDAVREADAVMLVTKWKEFQRLPEVLEGVAPQPLVIDGRRVLDRARLERYEGIGLGAMSEPKAPAARGGAGAR